ncbi:hypothetical protein FNF29_05472 [Cafeteria roenbergensis]|uniref:Ankyrin repeat domain-containing protein n=1 Tax=Cafeteria roenbergensis TaxID=33653 RepID=A0A5A8CAU4_CAFRO|nr:hypothetical protein FNF29_05472 [Cafeteria roenbergensis]|eukprot:KAA0150232.1 hypothetical protein FNF29_05472 [Cafeteria roenbergensis]
MAAHAADEETAGAALWEAAKEGNTAEARRLLDAGAPVDWKNAAEDRATAMMKAASAGHKDTVELLLDRGADLGVKDDVSAVVACPARRAAKSVTGRQRPRRR